MLPVLAHVLKIKMKITRELTLTTREDVALSIKGMSNNVSSAGAT